MSKAQAVALAATLLASGLLGCSRSEMPSINFTPTGQTKKNPNPQAAFEAAKTACQEEARRKGIANMTAILLRRSKTSETAYVECMRGHGFETTQ
jgi:phosphoribosyl-dephospho-CoA transferase